MKDKIFGTVVKLETITNWNLPYEKYSVRKFLIISQKPLEKESAYSFIENFITSPRKFQYPKPTGERTDEIQTLEIIKEEWHRKENLGKLGCEIPITIFHETDETLFFSVGESKEFSSKILKELNIKNNFEDFIGLMVIKKEIEITKKK
jgi:hypothetical protein